MNSAGVIPIIFAVSIMYFPMTMGHVHGRDMAALVTSGVNHRLEPGRYGGGSLRTQ